VLLLPLPPLCLQVDQAGFAPLLQLRTLNPYLGTLLSGGYEGGVAMPRTPAPWPWAAGGNSFPRQTLPAQPEVPVCGGGVSSFAFMGTNAHAIIIKGSGLPSGKLLVTGYEFPVASGVTRVSCSW
jgi:acyl transferase domain-containing protein